MIENSSKTVKEISNEKEVENLNVEENNSETSKEEDLSLETRDIPSADSSSSRRNNDLDSAGFTQEDFASLLSLIHI